MKRFFLIFTMAALFCGIAACSSSTESPDTVVKHAIISLQKGDYDAYVATYNLSDSDQIMLSGIIEEKMGEELARKGGIKSFEITDTQIDGETASVKTHLIYNDGSEEDQTMNLVLVDGNWKQEINK